MAEEERLFAQQVAVSLDESLRQEFGITGFRIQEGGIQSLVKDFTQAVQQHQAANLTKTKET